MKKITLTLVLASLLAGAGCSQKKEAAKEATPPPVDAETMKTRMEDQQKAIKNASDQLQKRQETQAAATPTATP